MKKTHLDSRIFCIATIVYWIFSLTVYFLPECFNLQGRFFDVFNFLATVVIIATPIFGFVMPIVLLFLTIFHSVKDKRFNALPLVVLGVNTAHTALMYHLMVGWF